MSALKHPQAMFLDIAVQLQLVFVICFALHPSQGIVSNTSMGQTHTH